ncbi:MAG: PEP/pyruvate-binding domain-containing protein [Acidobacteriota bacterium]
MVFPRILDLSDVRAQSPAAAGGKGASLAKLLGAGFPVPSGVVLTADASRSLLAADERISAALGALASVPDADRPRACVEIRDLVEGAQWPAGLRAELEQAVAPLLASGSVAVRSSATFEDLAGAAFAGQHDTVLGITHVGGVAAAVGRAVASLWRERAVAYRRRRGFADGPDLAMAVVIQAMVPAEVAGVAFTLDPVTGDPDRLVIGGAFGLGETVVAGEDEVDQVTLDKASGEVLGSHVGEQAAALVLGEAGTERRELGEAGERCCLDGRLRRAVADLALRVERFAGFPQDLEWAFAGDRVFLLQARPVTRIPERFTRDESAERFPNAMTPLTWDYTSDGFHVSLEHSLSLLGLPRFDGRWFERLGGYVYGNQNAIRVFTAGRQVAFDSLDELAEMAPRLARRYGWVQELPVTWTRDLDRYLRDLGALASVDLSGLSEEEVFEHLSRIDALGTDYFRPNIAISIVQSVLHRMLFRVLELVTGPEAPAVYDALTGFCETKTHLVNRDLQRLVALARRDDDLVRLLGDTCSRTLWGEGRLEAHPEFMDALGRFLDDHGHREVDFDAYHPTWSGQPWVVLDTLRLLLRAEPAEDPAARENRLRARQRRAEERLLGLVPSELRFFVAELVRLARTYTALDDLEHYQTTRLSVPFRGALVALGERLVGRGIIDCPEDIFFLRKETLRGVVLGTMASADARAEAWNHKREHDEQRCSAPPHVWGDDGAAAATADGDLRGIPGSPGSAAGPVFRVYEASDFARFPQGAVLVARTTNPAWTPLFYTAAAVVTESGGPLSHGAITAREVGVPAIMAVRGAMATLADGDWVRVDGTTGVVTRLATPATAVA